MLSSRLEGIKVRVEMHVDTQENNEKLLYSTPYAYSVQTLAMNLSLRFVLSCFNLPSCVAHMKHTAPVSS